MCIRRVPTVVADGVAAVAVAVIVAITIAVAAVTLGVPVLTTSSICCKLGVKF